MQIAMLSCSCCCHRATWGSSQVWTSSGTEQIITHSSLVIEHALLILKCLKDVTYGRMASTYRGNDSTVEFFSSSSSSCVNVSVGLPSMSISQYRLIIMEVKGWFA